MANKYHAVKVRACAKCWLPSNGCCYQCGTTDVIAFDSKGEHHRALELRILERAGQIRHLKRQTPFEYTGRTGHKLFVYRADFTYLEDCKPVVEDFKGYRTDYYRLKKKLIQDQHDIEIRETGRKAA